MRHDFIALPPQRKTFRNLLLGSSFLLSLLAVSGVAHAAPAQVEGELEVLHVHNFDKTTHNSYFLRGNDGKRYELKFKKHAPSHITGTKIRVKGEQSGNVLALDSSGGTSLQVLAMPAPNTFGAQKTAVLMVNFQDNQTQPYTTSQASSTVFGESSNFVKDNSTQQTWLTGNVFGWYTLPIAQTCDYLSIQSYARQAAANAGVDLSPYTRHIIVMPQNTNCHWNGLATVGGTPSTSWLNQSLNRHVVTHEMGHNFGLFHAHFQDCDVSALGSTCSKSEYGDVVDTMGMGSYGHYNAFQKERLGWLNYGTSPAIATIESGSGTFSLEPYSASSSGTKAVKVLKSIDPTTGQKSWYYVEYRQPIGFDSSLSSLTGLIKGVLIHLGTDGNGNSSDLLDMTPNSDPVFDAYDASLGAGLSYTDSTSGVTITLLSVSSSGAAVSVSMNGQTPTPTCTHANPGIAMSTQSASVAPGTAVTYTVSVTNTDSSACSSSQFNLSSVVPAGWTVSPASATLNLAPGSSGSTSVVVTSPTTATAGFYTISGKAVNSSATSFTASASTTYTVATSSTTPPTTTTNKPPVAVSDSVATTAGTAVKISVLVNDSDPEGKALTIKSVGLPARGTAVVNADGTVTYKPNGKFKGSDSFTYTISDGVNTASATASVQVTR